jgi:serum/glucocorticoid-regulated kinase 2
MGDDIFLGAVKVLPDLDSMGSQDEWHDIRGGDGQIKIGYSFKPQVVSRLLFLFGYLDLKPTRINPLKLTILNFSK